MDDTSRKLSLVMFAICIVGYAGWTVLAVFAALMAESGGKDSQPWMALFLLWPMGELIWTWIRIARDPAEYDRVSGTRRWLFAALVALATIAPLAVVLVMSGDRFVGVRSRVWDFAIPGTTIVACWVARLVWSAPRPEES